jgi:beta-galactosidase GanA
MIPDSEHRILNSDRLEETMTMTAIGDSTPINSTDVAADTRDTLLQPSARTILTRELAATTAAGVFDAMSQQPSPVDQRAAQTQPHPGALHRRATVHATSGFADNVCQRRAWSHQGRPRC